jgi:chondroitin synthase
MKEVSLIIPVYNCKKYLEATLYGLSIQTYPKQLWEVIISDDGSKDGIEKLIYKFKDCCNLRLIHNHFPQNRIRLASVRNRGIIAAKNEVIITLDADCIPLPEFIESHLLHFINNSKSLAVIGLRKFICLESSEISNTLEISKDILNLPNIISISNFGEIYDRRIPEIRKFDKHPMPYNCFHTCNASFLKTDALDVGLFDKAFDGHWGYEDIEFGYRLWKNGVRFEYEPKALVLHQENILHSFEERMKGKAVNFELACERIPGFREFRKNLGR